MPPDATFGAAQARALFRLVAGTDIEELEVEHDGVRVLIRRDPSGFPHSEHAAEAAELGTRSLDGVRTPAAPGGFESLEVRSSVVGLFLRGREPGSTPLVTEGDSVTQGQPLAVIESLRVPHTVESPVAGVVERIIAQDGHPVEYGQPVMLVRPA